MIWRVVPIGQACLRTEVADPTARERFRYVDISSIDRSAKTIVEVPELAGAEAPSRARKVIRAGDVLVSTVRPNLNAVARVPDDLDGDIASTGFCVLRTKNEALLGRYLFYYCSTSAFITELTAKVRGAQYPAVSDNDVREVQIPLPPLSEQHRIVEILDQADRLRRLRAEADAKADRILPALFIKMFGDPATNPMGWPRRPIDHLATVTTGSTPSRRRTEYYGNYLEWVKSDNLNTPSHCITSATEYLSEIGAKVGRTAPPGSTLVTCIAGSPGAIGNAALADREIAFNQQINAATPRENVDPYFLYAHFLVGKRLVQAASTGGMKGIVTKSRFSAIEFLSPPPELQQRFARQCKAVCDDCDVRLRQFAVLDRTFDLLLHRAFSADLTAPWREAHMKELLQEMEQQAKALGHVEAGS